MFSFAFFAFCSPVIIEVPHLASLRGKEREICILRSDNGQMWQEHTMEATDEAVHDALDGSFEGNCQRSSYACAHVGVCHYSLANKMSGFSSLPWHPGGVS